MIESSGNDIRQVINFLQLWNVHGSQAFSAVGMKDDKVMINNFEAAYRLLNISEGRYKSFREKLDLFFVDHEWVPLLVQESYLTSFEKRSSLDDLKALADAAESVSLGDTLNRQVRIN